MTKAFLLGAAVLAAIATTPATAASYLLTYTATNAAAPLVASVRVTTPNTLNANGTFDVLTASGNVAGDVITALTPNPNQPNAAGSADGLFTYDNTLSLTAPFVSGPGLLFTSATFEYNLFSDSPTQYELYQANGGGYTENSVGTLTLTAVPEPAAWTLMIAGFGLVGAAARRRSVAAAA